MADKIEWCGDEYDVADLKSALAVLLPFGTSQDQLLAQDYSDPWAPDTWTSLGDPAQFLLTDLAQAPAGYNAHVSFDTSSSLTNMHHCASNLYAVCFGGDLLVWQLNSCGPDCIWGIAVGLQLLKLGRMAVVGWLQNEWELPGAVLLSKAEALTEMSGELKPSQMCKAHHLFAGATLLLRCGAALEQSVLQQWPCFLTSTCRMSGSSSVTVASDCVDPVDATAHACFYQPGNVNLTSVPCQATLG